MPITWRLSRDHIGPPFSSDTRFVAISGGLVIGSVFRVLRSKHREKFAWRITEVNAYPSIGVCDTLDQAKAALQLAWLAWVAHAGLKDDPDAAPVGPQKSQDDQPS